MFFSFLFFLILFQKRRRDYYKLAFHDSDFLLITYDLYTVARINMVKADKARAVEDLLIRLAQSNQLRNKVSEQQLIDLLGQINQQEPSASQTKIVVSYISIY